MSLILNIDTATEYASVCLSKGNLVLAFRENNIQQTHASFLQLAIQQLLIDSNIELAAINAIAVTIGPGSYTGLRVGLASAKGLCFALNIPLITINTLDVLANAIIQSDDFSSKNKLICPMIDARRMEVFTALFTENLASLSPTQSVILNEKSFEQELLNNSIIFCGSGAKKFADIIQNSKAEFDYTKHSAKNMISLALQKFETNSFSSIAYTTPLYGKEFYSTMKI